MQLRWAGGARAYDVYTDAGVGLGILWMKARVKADNYLDGELALDTLYSYQVRPVGGAPSRLRAVRTGPSEGAPVDARPAASRASASQRPSATPVPADTILLGLMSSNDYVDELGELIVVGVVRNDAQRNAADARVVLTLYDSAGAVIDEIQGSPLITLLQPGQRSPFVVSVRRPDNLREWSLRAAARPSEQQPQDGLTIINSHGAEDRAGFYHVTGTVINGGSRTTRLAQVVVTLYDQWGKIVNAGFAYTDPSSIQIGAEAHFDCSFNYFPRVAEFSVQLEWD